MNEDIIRSSLFYFCLDKPYLYLQLKFQVWQQATIWLLTDATELFIMAWNIEKFTAAFYSLLSCFFAALWIFLNP